MIHVTNLGMHFGRQVLFHGATFQLNQGNRYGLVGANGSGKSTLISILSGDIMPEEGEIHIPSALSIGVLSQDHFAYENDIIIDVVLMGKPALWKAFRKKKQLIPEAATSEEQGHELARLEMNISDLGGYQAESEASELLAGLGIPVDQQHEPLRVLSGGYRLRVLLAQCLFSRPDVLLLDEPTNHLDLGSIVWLENYLCDYQGTCVVISHDQYFLNRISTHIIDIDYETIKIYTGNYAAFTEAKQLERNQREKEIEQQEKKKEELQQFIDRFKAKATKARQANSKFKQIQRMDEIVIKRSSRISPSFSFEIKRPSGKLVCELDNVTKSFGSNTVLKNLSFKIERGAKIAVIGANGIGKSTFVKLLSSELGLTSGNIKVGYEVQAGYCPQDHGDIIPGNTTPYEWLYSLAPWETIGCIRGLLGRVLLQGDDVNKSTSSLSGGESARLIFARIMLEKPNLLLLDEPTNHMDIESLEALSKGLVNYEGTIVCVSHDRRFIESFATAILELKPDGYDFFKGTYKEYLEKQGVDYLSRESLKADNQEKRNKDRAVEGKEWRQLSKEKGRIEKLIKKKEEEIADLERDITEIDQTLADVSLYQDSMKTKLNGEISRKQSKEQQLVRTMQEWEALHEKLDHYEERLN